jgi:hypothetical protein
MSGREARSSRHRPVAAARERALRPPATALGARPRARTRPLRSSVDVRRSRRPVRPRRLRRAAATFRVPNSVSNRRSSYRSPRRTAAASAFPMAAIAASGSAPSRGRDRRDEVERRSGPQLLLWPITCPTPVARSGRFEAILTIQTVCAKHHEYNSVGDSDCIRARHVITFILRNREDMGSARLAT